MDASIAMRLPYEKDAVSAPAISVVLPTRNRAQCLMRAVQSVLWQTWEDLELVVVDDGSADDTFRVLRAIEDPRVRVLRHPSARGAAAARNTGIAGGRSSWIAFQDSDDIWMPDKLERQMAMLGRGGREPAVAWCGMLRLLAGGAQHEPSLRDVRRDGAMLPGLLWGPVIGTQTLLVRRDAVETIGGFDEALECCEDWELAIRLAREYQFAFAAEILVIAPKADDGLSVSMKRTLRGRERVLEKHRGLFALYPEIEAKNLYDLGYLAMLTDEVSRARIYLKEALRRQPYRAKYAAAYASAIAGAPAFRRGHQLVGRLAELGQIPTARVR